MESIEVVKQKSQDVILNIIPNVTSEELSDDIDLFGLGLDSVNAIMLIMNLQDTFNINFETSEISLENFRTLGDIIKLIQKKQGISALAKD